ncbi:ATP-dependent helicase HrpA [Pokkaliibacter plantistimulans]|uniref:ATP-dependent helicase HrpA n=1 Tax=Proteobacteria bacterium 228 TaxID=2083153 RepID=A0A2S5KQI6_9PROT|nr:ATP-dependent helicase HrpA [Pokkaliibacter plantistimulans]PPC77028.1 ATP-dependent helicase HrpA [Pokkaliibacter plantistimulans]
MSSALGSIGGAGLQASQDALKQLDQTSAETTKMNAAAQSQKMKTDTINSIMNGYVDSANKANNAATQSGKAINY